MKKLKNVSVTNISERSDCLKALPEVWDIGQKSWKHPIKRSIASTATNKNFFLHLTETASQNGWLNSKQVKRMLVNGLMSLTDTTKPHDAWLSLFPSNCRGDIIAIKPNFQ